MNINSNLGSRTLVTLSVFCLALFLLSSIAAPSAFAKSTAGTNSGASDGVRGYSTSNAPSLASGACPSPIQKGAAKSIALGSGVEPTGVAYDPKNKNIYVTTTQGYFEVISTSTNKIVGGKISVDNSLGAIAVDSSSGQVFVASKTQSEVYVFNPVVAQGIALPTNSIPTYMIYDAFNGKVYVSDTFAKSISVIDTSSRAISNIALGVQIRSRGDLHMILTTGTFLLLTDLMERSKLSIALQTPSSRHWRRMLQILDQSALRLIRSIISYT